MSVNQKFLKLDPYFSSLQSLEYSPPQDACDMDLEDKPKDLSTQSTSSYPASSSHPVDVLDAPMIDYRHYNFGYGQEYSYKGQIPDDSGVDPDKVKPEYLSDDAMEIDPKSDDAMKKDQKSDAELRDPRIKGNASSLLETWVNVLDKFTSQPQPADVPTVRHHDQNSHLFFSGDLHNTRSQQVTSLSSRNSTFGRHFRNDDLLIDPPSREDFLREPLLQRFSYDENMLARTLLAHKKFK